VSAPTARRTRAKFGVDKMSEGNWLVRGTLDPVEALKFVVDEMDAVGAGAGERRYGDLDPRAVQTVADWCHDMLQHARPGLYRKNPCGPGSWGRECEGWAWNLGYAKQRGPGTFEGVYFDAPQPRHATNEGSDVSSGAPAELRAATAILAARAVLGGQS